ncbi:MAG: STAS domain-containing protein [Acutalibacteraceae bacterium]|nr:STAS domain-containing protein [Acutalibacteraceae bacterium]
MTITIDKNNEATVLKIEGRLDTTTAPELENAINGEGDALKNLVLDFEKVNYISSAGLRVLLTAQKKMNVQGSMELINVSEDVMDILEMTGFADILVIK